MRSCFFVSVRISHFSVGAVLRSKFRVWWHDIPKQLLTYPNTVRSIPCDDFSQRYNSL
jgi:hypothetical protein